MSNRDSNEVVTRGVRVSFGWSPEAYSLSKSNTHNPLHSALSETLRTAQTNANSLVLYAKQNPNLQRLVTGYELWESNLRKEASARLGGFKPLQQVLDSSLADDWDLLKRVKSTNNIYGTSLKRSASDNSLSSAADGVRKPAKQRVHLSSDWDLFSALNTSGQPEFGTYRPVQPRHGLPRVATESSLELDSTSTTFNNDAARNLEAVAVTILETSKQALQTAQQSLQETATNCQQNLQSLTVLLQQNLPVQPQNMMQQIVQRPNGSAQQNSSLVPWSVLPRYLRAREFAAEMYGDSTEEQKENYNILEQMQEYLDNLQGLEGKQQRRGFKSLRDPGRQVAIVTTASLPWMTGTAVNPLLRAAFLANDTTRKVTLLLPWLSQTDQARVFPNNMSFDTPEAQEQFVREWAQKRTGLDCNFKVVFYPGRYAAEKGSILPVGDITQYIPDHEADVAVLEEPEHLNWYHHGRRWTDKFNHVVGVMHTNYLDYARREEGGAVKEAVLRHINAWVCRIHCHKVVKLSDAVQPLPREQTMFVHGVSPNFLEVGRTKAAAAEAGEHTWSKGAYFLGKVLWAKGYTELLERLEEHAEQTGTRVDVDVFGTGPDMSAVQEEAGKRQLPLRFNGAMDHADKRLQDYKVFINPSLSDVVATTTAEALAMGKFVVCAEHPSNRFFQQFPNCLIYRTPQEFSQCLDKALHSEPSPLSSEALQKLTWEAATERFLDVAEVNRGPGPMGKVLDNILHAAHNTLTGVESLRVAAGAGSNTLVAPARVADYQPCHSDVGGFFDDKNRARRMAVKKVVVKECSSSSADAELSQAK